MQIVSKDFGTDMLERFKELESKIGLKLSKFQMIILAEMGTLEQILSIIVGSPIQVEILKMDDGPRITKREVWLKNRRTGERLVHASTVVYRENLPNDFLRDLRGDNTGIGSLLVKYALETYRRVIDLGYSKNTRQLFRKYEILHNGKVLFTIEEKFDIDLFKDAGL
jgi:chorismate-pyruvate lyase